MSWKIIDGRPTKVEVKVGVAPAEVTPAQITVELVCAECGKEYKTETGLDRHITDKH